MNTNFDLIRNEGRLLYHVLRGSHAYNLATEKSDEDYSAVYLCNPKELLGLGFDYKDQLSDAKHDNTWFEVGCYLKLLLKSNPTVMEYLFVPERCIVGDIHPMFMPILANKKEFLSKQLFNPLFGYAKQQLNKCKGYNKMCNWEKDKVTRKTPFDFCYTFKDQGSTKMLNWLENRGLKQRYCGLANTPNMHDVYGVFYDFGNHFLNEKIEFEQLYDALVKNEGSDSIIKLTDFIIDNFKLRVRNKYGITDLDETIVNLEGWFYEQKPIGYKGIMGEDGESNEVRLSSIEKDVEPICHMSYNQTGYVKHCGDYKNYQTWLKERNPVRFESNLNHNYDAKNVSHMVRLIHMGLELAQDGSTLNVERTWDRDFILKVKNHGFEFDEIMAYIEEKTVDFNKAIETSTLKEKIDVDFVNDLLIDIRKQQLKSIV